jgi:hypothetical protein
MNETRDDITDGPDDKQIDAIVIVRHCEPHTNSSPRSFPGSKRVAVGVERGWMEQSRVNTYESTPGLSVFRHRPCSPIFGSSSLITSAPSHASISVDDVPTSYCVRSITVTPANAFLHDSSPGGQRATARSCLVYAGSSACSIRLSAKSLLLVATIRCDGQGGCDLRDLWFPVFFAKGGIGTGSRNSPTTNVRTRRPPWRPKILRCSNCSKRTAKG